MSTNTFLKVIVDAQISLVLGQYIDRAFHQLPVFKSGLEQLLLFNYQEDPPKDSSKLPSIHITQFVETPIISYFNLIQACQNLVSVMRSIFKDQDFINAIFSDWLSQINSTGKDSLSAIGGLQYLQQCIS